MQSEVGSSPCLFQHCQHSKARGAAATKGGGAGEGGSAPPQWEQDRVCPSQQGLDTPVSPSRHRQQSQGTGGDSLGVPHAAEPTQGQGCHRQCCHTCPFPQRSHHSPGGTGSPSPRSPLEPRGSQCDPPPIQLPPDPQKTPGKFLPNRPEELRGRNGPVPLPWHPVGPGWADLDPSPSPGRGEDPGPPRQRGRGSKHLPGLSLCRRLLHPPAHPMPRPCPPALSPPCPPLSIAACVGGGGGQGSALLRISSKQTHLS